MDPMRHRHSLARSHSDRFAARRRRPQRRSRSRLPAATSSRAPSFATLFLTSDPGRSAARVHGTNRVPPPTKGVRIMSRIRSIQQGSRRILVTGGAGFIGTHLCRSLLTGGNSVTIVDDCSTGRPENVRKLREEFPGARITFLEGDVRDALPHLVHVDFDEIHHLASVVGVRLIVDQPVHAAEVNFECTSRVLRFALEARSHHGRSPVVLLASSSEVYGRSCKLPLAEDEGRITSSMVWRSWRLACSTPSGRDRPAPTAW
ncbi:MAG: NAD-dependent epimerase/dehydratase family protein [Candidatus Eisenbacteria bacterium]|uniref:UDP-glucuronate decarboxylase n=1 Tax=Eiseniibacteriota bacterium TaxID=2212470 RepID=A0A538UBF6_UNCEI|nr:MAG: NAD-dependent epimerase/dehydratase family protein [Candidatus Eisenbacteria bacterium]